MERDPPPSYSSIIRSSVGSGDQLRRRNIHDDYTDDTNPHNNFGGKDNDSKSDRNDYQSSDNSQSLGNTLESQNDTSCSCELRNKTGMKADETATLSSQLIDNAQQQSTQRIGLWGRIKKGLEDVAMFIIQVLD